MLWLIADRLKRGICDDVLEVAWSTMWNVTDETPQNCQKFLEHKGMEFFLKCLEVRFEFSFFFILFYFRLFISARSNSQTRRNCYGT